MPVDITQCKYLGHGHSGVVYLMPDFRAIKIFKNSKSCREEFDILKKTESSKHFPKAYELGKYYIIREYASGINAYEYLLKNGIERSFVEEFVDLFDDMKNLGFKKLEIRFPHLFVKDTGNLMLIDPRKSYTEKIPYPKSFLRKLSKMGLINEFMETLNKIRPDLKWKYN